MASARERSVSARLCASPATTPLSPCAPAAAPARARAALLMKSATSTAAAGKSTPALRGRPRPGLPPARGAERGRSARQGAQPVAHAAEQSRFPGCVRVDRERRGEEVVGPREADLQAAGPQVCGPEGGHGPRASIGSLSSIPTRRRSATLHEIPVRASAVCYGIRGRVAALLA
jgi:hypothetical protein